MERKTKIVAIIVLVLMLLPIIRQPFNKLNPLKGAYTVQPFPAFSVDGWVDKTFQDKVEKAIEDDFGFRPGVVRFANQVNYTLFSEFNPKAVLIGKENWLYEGHYVIANKGNDFLGLKRLQEIVGRLKALEEKLSKSNTKLLVLLAPDKVSVFPEYIPEKHQNKIPGDSLNWHYFSALMEQSDIPYIDFSKFFIQEKPTSPHMLFPKYGSHWSMYGAAKAIDTVVNTLQGVLGYPLGKSEVNDYDITTDLRGTDYDIGEYLNLIVRLPSPEMAYPVYAFDTVGYKKPNIITFGDSFYITIFKSAVSQHLFNIHHFLFYGKPYNSTISREEYIADYTQYDVVIVELTAANLLNIDEWGFPYSKKQ